MLYNIYINDLAISLKSITKGIDTGNEKICVKEKVKLLDVGVAIGKNNFCMMFYTGDTVLIEESDTDLQL